MTLSGPAHRTRTPQLSRVTRSLGHLFAIALNMLFLYVPMCGRAGRFCRS
jgi:hypothetical protein